MVGDSRCLLQPQMPLENASRAKSSPGRTRHLSRPFIISAPTVVHATHRAEWAERAERSQICWGCTGPGTPSPAAVGQRGVVVVESRFDAGYFVTVRLGKQDFRGKSLNQFPHTPLLEAPSVQVSLPWLSCSQQPLCQMPRCQI